MIKNYIKIAIRILRQNKLFAFVNILGLSLSMAVGVILFTGIKGTLDTDHFHPQLDKTVRVLTQAESETGKTKWATAPLPLASRIQGISFVEKTVKVRLAGEHNLQTDGGDIPIDVKFSEPSFFDVFGFTLLSGNAQSLSNNTTSLFLTESTADRIFGTDSALGKTVTFENLGTYTVGGIIEDPPLETHMPIEAMLSINVAEMLEKKDEISSFSHSWEDFKSSAIYARLNSKDKIKQLNATLKNCSCKTDNVSLEFFAQPLDDITPRDSDILNDQNAGVSWEGIKTQLFLILALTLLSAFNYISLSLTRAFSRAREIGIRKTVGATRGRIIGQFLTEATLVSLFALLFTVPCVYLLMRYVPEMDMAFSFDATLTTALLAYAVITGLVAGALPAWLLSTFRPIQIIREFENIKLFKFVSFYKILIVVQFAVTIMLTVFFVTLTDYVMQENEKISEIATSNILTLDLKGEDYEYLQNEINQLSQVQSTFATNWYYDTFKMDISTIRINDKSLKIRNVNIDPRVIESEGISLKAGQNFPYDMPQNSEQYVLINEAASKLIGFELENLVGQELLLDSTYAKIASVTPNQTIGETYPLIYRHAPNDANTLIIKASPNMENEVTEAVRNIWSKKFHDKKVNIYPLKDHFSGDGNRERIGFFAGLALIVMIIAGLGILGIASYSVDKRRKEMGIRRVMGASNIEMIWSTTKDFVILILIAGLIGVPAGLFCGHLLRKEMGSAVELSFMNTSIGFGLVAVVGLLTVLSQTIRAGQIDPVKVLNAE